MGKQKNKNRRTKQREEKDSKRKRKEMRINTTLPFGVKSFIVETLKVSGGSFDNRLEKYVFLEARSVCWPMKHWPLFILALHQRNQV